MLNNGGRAFRHMTFEAENRRNKLPYFYTTVVFEQLEKDIAACQAFKAQNKDNYKFLAENTVCDKLVSKYATGMDFNFSQPLMISYTGNGLIWQERCRLWVTHCVIGKK